MTSTTTSQVIEAVMNHATPALVLAAAVGAAKCLYWFWRRRQRQPTSVRDKVVVITGGSSGLGRSLGCRLHSEGARVILAARSLDKLSSLCSSLKEKKLPNTHDPIHRYLDLMDPKGFSPFIREVVQEFGRIDILINNAGKSMRGSCEDTDIRVHREIMDLNYFGQVELTQTVLPYLIDAQGGMVVVISSVQGKIATPYRSGYGASKHALQAYFDSFRAEVASKGVRVLTVSPGYIKTDLSMSALTGSGEEYGRMDATTAAGTSPDVIAAKITDAIESGEEELVLAGLKPRIAIALRFLLPSVYFYIMKQRAMADK